MQTRPVLAILLCGCLLLSSCSNVEPFAGDWAGSGVDSDGNEFTFAAKVTALEDNGYRVLVLDTLDSQKEPLHIMKGILEDNKFVYTADEGLYSGGGELKDGIFTGFYLGPVDGTFTMQRLK
jgi:hypothetical protein